MATNNNQQLEKKKVSVIIPSYNSSAFVEKCLESLRSQQTTIPFEIVMVDSSSDGTNELVKTKFPEVKLIHFDEQCSCGKARNIGIRETSTDFILFIDTDCIAEPTWIEEMTLALTDDGADAVCGAFKNGTPSNISGTAGFYLEFFRFLSYSGKPKEVNWLVGGNSGFKRSILESFEYVDSNLGDDFLMSYHLRQEGKKVLFLPNVAICHLNKTGFKRVWNYQKLIGNAAARYRKITSRQIMSIFITFPLLSFLTPFVIIPWITFYVSEKQGIVKLIKFILLTPVTFVMALSWAIGFYEHITQKSGLTNLTIVNNSNK